MKTDLPTVDPTPAEALDRAFLAAEAALLELGDELQQAPDDGRFEPFAVMSADGFVEFVDLASLRASDAVPDSPAYGRLARRLQSGIPDAVVVALPTRIGRRVAERITLLGTAVDGTARKAHARHATLSASVDAFDREQAAAFHGDLYSLVRRVRRPSVGHDLCANTGMSFNTRWWLSLGVAGSSEGPPFRARDEVSLFAPAGDFLVRPLAGATPELALGELAATVYNEGVIGCSAFVTGARSPRAAGVASHEVRREFFGSDGEHLVAVAPAEVAGDESVRRVGAYQVLSSEHSRTPHSVSTEVLAQLARSRSRDLAFALAASTSEASDAAHDDWD